MREGKRELSAASDLASVRVDVLRRFGELVTSLGGDPAGLLEKAHIEFSTLDDQKGVIAYSQMVELFEQASVELACPDFGLRLARTYN